MFIYSEEFAAHGANISCLALGQKSGLVLATGGSDNIVKLWKVDSETCFMVIYYYCFFSNVLFINILKQNSIENLDKQFIINFF